MPRTTSGNNSGEAAVAPSSHSTHRAIEFLAGKTIPHLPPFAVWLGEWPVAFAAHLQWGGSSIASAFLTLSAVGITGVTWWAGIEGRVKTQRLVQSVVTSAAASGWFAAAAIGGPTTELAVNTWLMGGPTLALAWSVKKVMRTNPDKAATSQDSTEKNLLAKIGLARAGVKDIKASPNKVVMPIELDRGQQTHEDAAKAAKGLAGVIGVAENAVRWEKDPEDAGQGQYIIVPEDMLKTPTPWPGPSAPGASVGAAPIPAGIYEDGPSAALWFPGDESDGRNAAHYQFMGMTGAGKSQGGRVVLTDLMTRCDVVTWLFDPSKGVQTFGPLLAGADWALLSMKECQTGIDALPRVITARANWLGLHSYDQWTVEAGQVQNSREHTCRSDGQACGCPGMPYIVVWFEEVAKLFREGVDLAPITQEARSAGVTLVFSLQRSSHTSMDTDVRANITGSTVFGVTSGVDAGFALSDDTIDAGARPEQWRNNKPGYCYIEGPGLDEDRFATPIRTYLLDKDMAAQVIAAYSSVRPQDAGPVTAQAAGEAYTNRKRYHAAAAAAADQPDPGTGEEYDGLDPADLALHECDPEYTDIPVDIDKPLPDVPTHLDRTLGQAPGESKMSREESLAALEDVLNEFAARGQLDIGPAEVVPHLDRIGKSASWVRREFRRLADEGVLAEVEDADRPYRINVAQPV